MAKKKKKDQLSVIGVVSSVLKGVSQQRSISKSRAKHGAEPAPEEPKPKDTRTPEQIRTDVDATRAALVQTVARVKYDLDVPARAGDLRDRVAKQVPPNLRGETPARLAAGSILAGGLGVIAAVVTSVVRRGK